MEKRAWAFDKTYLRDRALFSADLELHLPSAIGVRVLHPKLKDAELRDDGVHADRHHLPHRDIGKRWNLDFEQACVLKIAFGVRQDLSRRVAASHGGGEEPKLRRAAGYKTELASVDQQSTNSVEIERGKDDHTFRLDAASKQVCSRLFDKIDWEAVGKQNQ